MVLGRELDCMCTFQISKKPNVLNLQFKFCSLFNIAPPRFISLFAIFCLICDYQIEELLAKLKLYLSNPEKYTVLIV